MRQRRPLRSPSRCRMRLAANDAQAPCSILLKAWRTHLAAAARMIRVRSRQAADAALQSAYWNPRPVEPAIRALLTTPIMAGGRPGRERDGHDRKEERAAAEIFGTDARRHRPPWTTQRAPGFATSWRLSFAISCHRQEAAITQGEWAQAIDFLTRAGKMCSESRQEFILLSDILGISMLVDAVRQCRGPRITDSTVLGSVSMPASSGNSRKATVSCFRGAGEPLVMTGHVTDPRGSRSPRADSKFGRPRPTS